MFFADDHQQAGVELMGEPAGTRDNDLLPSLINVPLS